MKKVVSFSGGRTSAYLVIRAIINFGPENVDVVCMDTGAEHQKTYEFIRKFSEYIKTTYGVDITFLRTDFNSELGKGNSYHIIDADDLRQDLKPFSEMMSKYGTPYIGGMFCTDRMKLVPYTKYCNEKYGRGNYETWLGIRADEPKRYLSEKVVSLLSDDDSDNQMFVEIFKSMRVNNGDVRGECDIFDGMWPEPSSYDRANFDCGWDRAVDAIDCAYANKTKGNLFYLFEISDFEKQDILDFWSEMPFDLEIPEHLGNCVFCPKKSNLKLAAAQRDEPESYFNFLSAIKSDLVRHDGKTGHWSKMYRGNQSLEQLIATFDGSTGDEIKERMRGGKMTESGSCSESCEVFVCEANQIDMFGAES